MCVVPRYRRQDDVRPTILSRVLSRVRLPEEFEDTKTVLVQRGDPIQSQKDGRRFSLRPIKALPISS